jgi:hypothetical protein
VICWVKNNRSWGGLGIIFGDFFGISSELKVYLGGLRANLATIRISEADARTGRPSRTYAWLSRPSLRKSRFGGGFQMNIGLGSKKKMLTPARSCARRWKPRRLQLEKLRTNGKVNELIQTETRQCQYPFLSCELSRGRARGHCRSARARRLGCLPEAAPAPTAHRHLTSGRRTSGEPSPRV